MSREFVRGWHLEIWQELGRYRAELWWNPYDGQIIAMTRWVKTRRKALSDARRVFPAFTGTSRSRR